MTGQLLAFIGIAVAVICVPGPDTALTIRNTLAGHRRAGVATAAGVAIGQLSWTVAVSFGLAGLLLVSAPVFQAVRWAGAAYLIFLGLQSLWFAIRRAKPESTRPATPVPTGLSPGRALRQGLLSNLANPKMAAFFLSVLPQFIASGDDAFIASSALGALFCVMTFGWLSGYAAIISRVRDRLLAGPVSRLLDGIAGVALVGFGVRLATE